MPNVYDNNDCADEERIKHKILCLLLEQKGYLRSDIIVDREFDVMDDNEIYKSSIDLLITLQGKAFMIIKCARGSLVSREREVLSCARIFESYTVPFSVVTNGHDVEIIDSINGKIIGYGLGAVPSRADALEYLQKIEFNRLPRDRAEKEKRIFLAFDAIRCPSECN